MECIYIIEIQAMSRGTNYIFEKAGIVKIFAANYMVHTAQTDGWLIQLRT